MNNVFLLVNIPDLDQCGNIPLFGSPVLFFIRPELGDQLLNIALHNTERVDDMYCVIQTSPERAKAIEAAISLIGKLKIKRVIRSLIKANLPTGKNWRQYTRPS